MRMRVTRLQTHGRPILGFGRAEFLLTLKCGPETHAIFCLGWIECDGSPPLSLCRPQFRLLSVSAGEHSMGLGVTRFEFESFHQLARSLRWLMLEEIQTAQRQMWPRVARRDFSRLLIIALGLGQAGILHCLIT